jgi:hypothetical protein
MHRVLCIAKHHCSMQEGQDGSRAVVTLHRANTGRHLHVFRECMREKPNICYWPSMHVQMYMQPL